MGLGGVNGGVGGIDVAPPRSYFDELSTGGPSPTPLDPSTWLRVSGHSRGWIPV